MKDESKELMLDFLDASPDDPRRSREGAYGSYEYGPEGEKVKVILLDTRYFRSPLARDTINGQRVYIPTDGTILGEEQWKWLEQELRETTAQVNLVVSSIQLIPDQQIYEKWANIRGERERFFDLLVETQAPGVIVLSGDRHIAEFSRMDIPGLSYPLIDFTSSGLTHTWSRDEPEENRYRVGKQVIALNYGLLELSWQPDQVIVKMSVRGHDGQVFETRQVSFDIR